MPAVSRKGDMSTGHGPWAPTAMISTPVKKTYFNGKLAGVVDAQHVSARVVAVDEVQGDQRHRKGREQSGEHGFPDAAQQEREVEDAHAAGHVEQQQGERRVAAAHQGEGCRPGVPGKRAVGAS